MLTSSNYIVAPGETARTDEMEPIRITYNTPKAGNTQTPGDVGFLTVVTRCFKRADKLDKNQRSLTNQTDPDYDQVLIHDDVGIGMLEANRVLNTYKHLIKGEYVLILDDDDMMLDDNFIANLKSHNEDIVLFRMRYTCCGPDRYNYIGGKEENEHGPRFGRIGASCMVVTNEVYQKHIYAFIKDSGGDYQFLQEILNEKFKYTKCHLGEVEVTAIQDIGGGQPDNG